jgi:hypothetical protein
MRLIARSAPSQPATVLFSEAQIAVLNAFSSAPTLGSNATILDAMMAVAALGGHIKNNGPPGWMVLARGYETLLNYALVWEAARCDQS